MKQTPAEKSLYEQLGGVYAIAAVVDHFSDAVWKNPIVGQKSKNPQLREWHTKNAAHKNEVTAATSKRKSATEAFVLSARR